VRLAKYHGLGNDFLLALVPAGDDALARGSELARRWCDRRRGVGADGLILGAAPDDARADDDVDAVMHLWNADGGRAEMSGNGIRCLAHALAAARSTDEASLTIATDGGIRTLAVRPGGDPHEVQVSVEMGAVSPGPIETPAVRRLVEDLGATRHATADLGNPHLVALVDDPAAVDLAVHGAAIDAALPTGVNVEVIAVRDTGHLDLRVWERGVGLTEACGTGACAAAALAHDWGLVGEHVRVSMPGGDAEVVVDGRAVTLLGPSVFVADVELAAEPEGAEGRHG
jgi:diaminopimelate epimerase